MKATGRPLTVFEWVLGVLWAFRLVTGVAALFLGSVIFIPIIAVSAMGLMGLRDSKAGKGQDVATLALVSSIIAGIEFLVCAILSGMFFGGLTLITLIAGQNPIEMARAILFINFLVGGGALAFMISTLALFWSRSVARAAASYPHAAATPQAQIVPRAVHDPTAVLPRSVSARASTPVRRPVVVVRREPPAKAT